MLMTFFWLQERPYLHARFFFLPVSSPGPFSSNCNFLQDAYQKNYKINGWKSEAYDMVRGRNINDSNCGPHGLPLHLHLQTTGWDHDHTHRCINSKMFLLWTALKSSGIGPIYFIYSLKLRCFQVYCNLLVIRTLPEVKFQGKSSQYKIRRTYGNCWQGHVPNTCRHRVLNNF